MLTDTSVRHSKAKDKPYKMADFDGLYLLVASKSKAKVVGKYWRFDFRFAGKRKTLAFGTYPEVSLSDARILCKEARTILAAKKNPADVKRAEKHAAKVAADTSFRSVALEWLETKRENVTNSHIDLMLSRLEADIFPSLGNRPIGDIEPLELLAVLRKVEERGVREIAHRLRQTCSQVFRYAMYTARAKSDPSATLKGVLKTAGDSKKHHKVMPRDDLPEFLDKLKAYDGDARTALALRLIVITFVRTGELRGAKWNEFERLDSAEPTWRIPPHRMKMRTEHLVPLPRQALSVIEELRALPGATATDFLFPSPCREGCMSNNTMLFALYRMGYHGRATVHGFRGLASTVLNEMGYNRDWIERQLAHDERDKVRAAYNSAQYMAGRREMMQGWADFLDSPSTASNVVYLKRA